MHGICPCWGAGWVGLGRGINNGTGLVRERKSIEVKYMVEIRAPEESSWPGKDKIGKKTAPPMRVNPKLEMEPLPKHVAGQRRRKKSLGGFYYLRGHESTHEGWGKKNHNPTNKQRGWAPNPGEAKMGRLIWNLNLFKVNAVKLIILDRGT